jgi:hypothetical protein
MAYTINKTDGTIIATITDGTIDTTTSLTLFGKSYSGFGELLNENLVKLLENQTSTASPTAPLKGELWFDANTNQLKVYDGSAFKPTGGAKSQATAPTSASAGDLWLDSDDNQVYFYTGSDWQLLSPVWSSTQTLSGWQIETLGSSGGDKVVASMYAGNVRVAILSKETFTPTVTQTGFASIKAGITLNSTLGGVFEGSSTSAVALDISSSTTAGAIIGGANFLRADVADTTTGAITIDADAGLIVGDAQELSISVSSSDVSITQAAADKDIIFKINDSDGGGAGLEVMRIDGSDRSITITGNLNITGEYNSTTSNVSTYDDAFIKVNTGNSEADAGLIVDTSNTDDARMFYDVSENFWSAGENASYSQVIRLTDAVADGNAAKAKVLKTSAAGNVKVTTATLAAVSAISYTDTSNLNVPTIGACATLSTKWGGSLKTVSTSGPSGGSDGDFWFVREA